MKQIRLLVLASITVLVTACSSSGNNYGDQSKAKIQRMHAASDINVQLGLGYMQEKQFQRAKEKLFLAIHQDPRSALAVGAMAYYWETTGNNQLASQYYRQAINLAPTSGRALNNYGVFLCRNGHYKQAEGYLLAAANDVKYIQTAAAFENAGLCALGIPNDTQAIAYFKRALEQEPNRQTSYYELVKLYKKHKNYALARKYYNNYKSLAKADAVPLSFNNQ